MTDTLFVNGCFWPAGTGEAPVRSLAARGGRILALSSRADGADLPPTGRRVDLQGRTAVPGPVDAHCHLVSYGLMCLREADLRGVGSLDELAGRLRAHADRLDLRPGDGRWLLGRGFDQEIMSAGAWPTREVLDSVAPDRPLRITRVCGHAMVLNTAGLRASGLDPEAGSGGFPPGVLTESDMEPVFRAIPGPTAAEWREAARWACREAARVGFVGVHSLMAHEREIRALVELHGSEGLPVRVLMQPPFAMLAALRESGLRTGFGDDWLRYGAVKLFSDGSLGARTAALEEPYSDDPAATGTLIYEPEELARRVDAVREAGWQVCIHAIGDRALRVTLDAIEGAANQGEGWAFLPRIEHASLVTPALLGRMRELGVGAAIQPQFARSDSWAPARLGDRAAGCYAFRSLHRAEVVLAGSTDCPVETLDALAAIGQLVHRPEWSPEEGLPLETALRIFSEGSYALQGRDPGLGRLEVGGYADFVVLEVDPRTVPPAEIEQIPVAATVTGGRVVERQDG